MSRQRLTEHRAVLSLLGLYSNNGDVVESLLSLSKFAF